jgi:hypothetical protein
LRRCYEGASKRAEDSGGIGDAAGCVILHGYEL